MKATLRRKQTNTPTNKLNSSKKANKHPNKQAKLFEESSTPTTKATL